MVLGGAELPAIDLDDVFAGVCLGPELRNDVAVHGHAPLLDQFFSFSAGRNAGVGEYLLQSFVHREFIVAFTALV